MLLTCAQQSCGLAQVIDRQYWRVGWASGLARRRCSACVEELLCGFNNGANGEAAAGRVCADLCRRCSTRELLVWAFVCILPNLTKNDCDKK